jgi:nicotinamidase-related amidase
VGWSAVDALVPLVALFRGRGWPVMYPHVAPKVATEGGRLAEKIPAIMNIPARGYEFVAEVAPHDGDVLIPKKHPSAFFATALCSHLIDKQVDTVVVVGCTTSGCVRGTVVDAFSLNFKVAVPQECVYDRSITSHKVNLFDIGQKYADVMTTKELIAALQHIA